MADELEQIDLGDAYNDRKGDRIRDGGEKIVRNFEKLEVTRATVAHPTTGVAAAHSKIAAETAARDAALAAAAAALAAEAGQRAVGDEITTAAARDLQTGLGLMIAKEFRKIDFVDQAGVLQGYVEEGTNRLVVLTTDQRAVEVITRYFHPERGLGLVKGAGERRIVTDAAGKDLGGWNPDASFTVISRSGERVIASGHPEAPYVARRYVEGTSNAANPARFLWDVSRRVLGLVTYGQSFALGGAGFDLGTALWRQDQELQPGYIWMPSTGAYNDGEEFSAFVAARPQVRLSGGVRNVGQLPAYSAAVQLQADLYAAFGEYAQIALLTVARGGFDLFQLWEGSADFNQFMRGIENCVVAARAQGRSFEVPAVCLDWGQAAFTAPYHVVLRGMILIRQAICRGIRARTGQAYDPVFCIDPVMRGKTTGAIEVATTNRVLQALRLRVGEWSIGNPDYAYDHGIFDGTIDGDQHLIVRGFVQKGQGRGRQLYRELFCQGWTGLVHRAVRWLDARHLAVDFEVPEGGVLQADTGNTIIGYPTDPGDIAYIGPATGSAARAGGFSGRSRRDGSQIGIEAFSVGSAGEDSLFTCTLTTHRDVAPGEVRVQLAARPTPRGTEPNTSGTRWTGARSVLQGSVGLPSLIDGDGETIRFRAHPFEDVAN